MHLFNSTNKRIMIASGYDVMGEDMMMIELIGSRYIRHSSFPVINPYNETFPESFHLYFPSQHAIYLSSNNTTHTYELDQPLAGSWFFVAYLDGEADNAIKQQVLFVSSVVEHRNYIYWSCDMGLTWEGLVHLPQLTETNCKKKD